MKLKKNREYVKFQKVITRKNEEDRELIRKSNIYNIYLSLRKKTEGSKLLKISNSFLEL